MRGTICKAIPPHLPPSCSWWKASRRISFRLQPSFACGTARIFEITPSPTTEAGRVPTCMQWFRFEFHIKSCKSASLVAEVALNLKTISVMSVLSFTSSFDFQSLINIEIHGLSKTKWPGWYWYTVQGRNSDVFRGGIGPKGEGVTLFKWLYVGKSDSKVYRIHHQRLYKPFQYPWDLSRLPLPLTVRLFFRPTI